MEHPETSDYPSALRAAHMSYKSLRSPQESLAGKQLAKYLEIQFSLTSIMLHSNLQFDDKTRL